MTRDRGHSERHRSQQTRRQPPHRPRRREVDRNKNAMPTHMTGNRTVARWHPSHRHKSRVDKERERLQLPTDIAATRLRRRHRRHRDVSVVPETLRLQERHRGDIEISRRHQDIPETSRRHRGFGMALRLQRSNHLRRADQDDNDVALRASDTNLPNESWKNPFFPRFGGLFFQDLGVWSKGLKNLGKKRFR